MSFRKEIEEGLEQILQMQELYRQVRDMEVLPLSFFSSSYDILKSLTASLHDMEIAQLNLLQQQLSEHQNVMEESNLLIKEDLPDPTEKKEVHPQDDHANNSSLVDTISKHLLTNDLKKAISLNDRFMFQRDLFGGDAKKMNETLDQLNDFKSLDDAMNFLNTHLGWNWENDSAGIFKEMLEKRFL